jgi:acyl-homoserine-lactone acylase
MAGGRRSRALRTVRAAPAALGALAALAAPATLAALLAAAPASAAASPSWWQRMVGTYPTLRIERTAHGLVHITAPDERALGYGLGYAHAQDHGCETADALVTVSGDRARWFGSSAGVRLGDRILDNRTSDFFVRAHLNDVALELGWNAATPEARALVEGVVNGYNRWLQDLTAASGAACFGQPWLRPMTVSDVRRLGELRMVADGEGAWADAIATAQPPGASPLRELPARPPFADGPGARVAASRPGGVAIAFGRTTTQNGAGLLLGDPHGSWSGPDRLWAVHLTIPGRLDVLGATPGTLPMLPAGFNRSLAWSTTRSPARHFTLHALRLAPDNPTVYLVDGQREPMTTRGLRTISRTPDGVEPFDRTLYRSRYGPIVVAPQLGLNWTRDTAWALQDADANDTRWADTWLDVAHAGSMDALRSALARQGTGDLVVVAADADGRVAYADPGTIPDLDADQWRGCRVPGPTGDLWAQHGLLLLDGSRAACDWHPAAGDASRKGSLAFERKPWLVREDWVQASGDNFMFAQPSAPGAALGEAARAGWIPLQGGEPGPLPLRTRAVVEAVQGRLAAAKGAAPVSVPASASAPAPAEPAAHGLGIGDVLALWYDPHNEAAHLVLEDLLAQCPQARTEATRSGCAALAHWDRSDEVSSTGAALFREWWRQVRELPGLWRVPYAAGDPLHTPRGLRWKGTGPAVSSSNFEVPRGQQLMDALAQAVFDLRHAGFAIDAPLGQVQFATVGDVRIAVPGGEAAEGTIITVEGRNAAAMSRTGYEPVYGVSWLQVVAFGVDGPVAYGLLVNGAAGGDDAPLRREGLEAFASRTWFPLPFTTGEVEAQRVGAPLVLKTW